MSPRGRRSPDNARDAVEALLGERLGKRGFGAAAELEAAQAANRAAGHPGAREDLRSLPTFTVDPASARDFDDALSAKRDGDGARVWVHIADVAAHVRPGSSLDLEARRRANSTYAPGAVEPMLPHALSSEACSLTPGVDRLTLTMEVELSAGGEPRSVRFYRATIRSDARLDYGQLDAIFAARVRAPALLAEPLAIAREVAAALVKRGGAGGLQVESFEPEFRFNSAGEVTGAHSVGQTESHRLIERLMILTNEAVARLLEQRRLASIYRVHPAPDPSRIERLIAQLHALGVPTPPLREGLSPRQASEVAAAASRLAGREAARRGHGRKAYTSLVLRSLKQAFYSEQNSGHAGLASSAYCHFTSPIRRYPDLLVQRALLAALGQGEEAPLRSEAREVAAHCSERERDSARIEHEADDICAAHLLVRELAERGPDAEFEGEVSALVRAGAFVSFGGALGDVYEGFLPARRLAGEYFELDQTETALLGSRSGARLRLGDPIAVAVGGIEAVRGRVELEPIGG